MKRGQTASAPRATVFSWEVPMLRTVLIPALAFLFLLQSGGVEHKPLYGLGMFMFNSEYPSPSCPAFVGGRYAHSPAARAGIQPGDALLSIDGQPVRSFADVIQHLSLSAVPGKVTAQFARGETVYRVTMEREEYARILAENGLKQVDGVTVDRNVPDAEVQDQQEEVPLLQKAMQSGDSRTIFTDRHYPEDKTLYYPGFEVFIWNHGTEITVGGIEEGPAQRSGVRWGDHILAINGVDPHGKSARELADLLSSPTPRSMALLVMRGDVKRTFTFDLERADVVLRENHLRVANRKIIPEWVSSRYLPCYVRN